MKCMEAKFGGHGLPGFEDFVLFCLPSKQPKFPFESWTIVHGDQKIESKLWQQTLCTCILYQTEFYRVCIYRIYI